MNMKTFNLPPELPGFFQEIVNGVEQGVAQGVATSILKPEVNRRSFLKFTGLVGGGLALGGFGVMSSNKAFAQPPAPLHTDQGRWSCHHLLEKPRVRPRHQERLAADHC